MEHDEPFVDAYSILQVHPECNLKELEAAYRQLAKMYHPDHTHNSDVDKFNEVIDAYRLIRSPSERAAYDLKYTENTGFQFSTGGPGNADETYAISDAESHAKILIFLYKRRRECAQNAGVGHYAIQDLLRCSDDNFEFYIWYLKEKGFIEITDQGTLAITIEGVDHVISTSRTTAREKLRIAQSHGTQDPMQS